MSSQPPEAHDPPRPRPPRRLSGSVTAWITWFGTGRMIAAAVSVVVVAFGAYWLVRAPLPSTEAGLPTATTVGSTTPTIARSTATTDPDASVVVHVVGAVNVPGVYELRSTSRVNDAIESAGGPATDAALDGVNLAATLADGQRIYVPVDGEVDPATVPSASFPAGATVAVGPVDINRATAGELETLPGIGPATATAIVEDRERSGPFLSIDDLDRVSGIGPVRLEALRGLVTV